MVTVEDVGIRSATGGDLESIRRIYNEGIEDRVATLDSGLKSSEEIGQWWSADLSVYVARELRGKGVGYALLQRLIGEAGALGFHKIVLHALDCNDHGKRLYRKAGFVEVGVFKEHGRLEGRYVDVIAMERLLA